jgi:hypothetical protein
MTGNPSSLISNHYTGDEARSDPMTQQLLRNPGAGEIMRIADLVTNTSQDGRTTLAKDEGCVSPIPADKAALKKGDKSGPAVSNSDIRQIKLNYLQLNKR